MLNDQALFVRAAIAVSAFVAVGCAPSTLRSLQFHNVRDVRILDITGSRMSMDLVADVEGHARMDVRLSEVTFDFALRGRPFARGRIPGPVAIPARRTATVTIPLELDFDRVTRNDLEALLSPLFSYRVTGTSLVEIGGRARRVALDATGTLPVSPGGRMDVGPCDAPWGLVRFRGVGSDLAAVLRGQGRVGLDVINPLTFPVDVAALDYRVASGSKPLGEGQLDRAMSLGPGTTSMELPIAIDRVNLLSTLASGWLRSAEGEPPPAFTVDGRLVLGSRGRTRALGFVCRS